MTVKNGQFTVNIVNGLPVVYYPASSLVEDEEMISIRDENKSTNSNIIRKYR